MSEGSVSITLEGRGLHSGAFARVHLRRAEVPETILAAHGVEAPITTWRAVSSERSTAIACQAVTLRTVEHLMAAVAGLGVRAGLRVEVEGLELPILDGTAARWLAALCELELPLLPSRRAPLSIACTGEVVVGRSVYRFRAGETVELRVDADFQDPRLVSEVSWDGSVEAFKSIASARTFCFAFEVEELARRGLASHVTPEMVVVIAHDAVLGMPAPAPDEPARHKLLDLMGDLFLYGGPPRGCLDAFRPGHQATHQAMREAHARGILVREG